MISLIPSATFTLSAALPQAEVAQALRPLVDSVLPRGNDRIKFAGSLDPNGFMISRHVRGRNPFVPTLHGSFCETSSGTTIRVRCLPGLVQGVFLSVWLFIVILCLIGYAVQEGTIFLTGFWSTLGIMLVFPYTLWIVEFNMGVSEARGILKRELEATESPTTGCSAISHRANAV